MVENDARVLHLFSSNFRPLYVQDCLDLLAKPPGTVQRFRYQRKWVSVPQVQGSNVSDRDKTSTWSALGKSTQVIVYFAWVANLPSMQDTVYVPLRRGRLIRAGVEEGSYFFVEFALGDYIDPIKFQPSSEIHADSYRNGNHLGLLGDLTSVVRAALDEKCPAGTYGGMRVSDGFSAVLSDATQGFGGDAPATWTTPEAFSNAASALGALLAVRPKAEEYADVFVRTLRIRRLRQSGDIARRQGVKLGGSCVDLRGGNLYELDVLILRTSASPEPITLSVTPPKGCVMVSHDSLISTSRYDKVTFRFFAEVRDNPTVGEMTLWALPESLSAVTSPADGAKLPKAFMPRAQFQVRVRPRRFLTLSAYLAAALTAVATFVLAIIGQKGVYLGANTSPTAGDNGVDLSALVSWFGGGSVAVSATALIVATITGLSAGGAAFLVLIRRRYGLST